MPAKPINQFMKEITKSTSLGDNDLVLVNKDDGSLYGTTQSSDLNTVKNAGGYTISGNTLTVTAATDPQVDYDRVAVDDLLGEPSATNNVWVIFEGINFEQGRANVESVSDVDGTYVLISTEELHGLVEGDYIELTAMSEEAYNSVKRVASIVSANSFTVENEYISTADGILIKYGVLQATANPYVGVIVDDSTTNLMVVTK